MSCENCASQQAITMKKRRCGTIVGMSMAAGVLFYIASLTFSHGPFAVRYCSPLPSIAEFLMLNGTSAFHETSSAEQTPSLPCDNVANMTILSAFFDIGDHQKGEKNRRKISEYFDYSLALAYIHTPLVFYTDSEAFATFLIKLRSRLHPNLTTVYRIKRDALWPFNLKGPISALYSKPGYPKHHPNTVLPDYSCSQHAKYACLLDLILHRPEVKPSDVYAWLDFGYYRHLTDKQEYCLKLPPHFDRNKASFNQVFKPNFTMSPKTIYYENHVWVGGGMVVATKDTMVKLCTEYQRSVEYWLFQHNLSSTDQQNLYASFSREGRRLVKFGVELNVEPGEHGWRGIGNSCLHQIQLHGNVTLNNISPTT